MNTPLDRTETAVSIPINYTWDELAEILTSKGIRPSDENLEWCADTLLVVWYAVPSLEACDDFDEACDELLLAKPEDDISE